MGKDALVGAVGEFSGTLLIFSGEVQLKHSLCGLFRPATATRIDEALQNCGFRRLNAAWHTQRIIARSCWCKLKSIVARKPGSRVSTNRAAKFSSNSVISMS